MAADIIREPQQQRSILKKKKITEAGLELICEKGYHNVTTVDIAKAAHVSTGIIYSYFKDKNDILLYGLRLISADIQTQLIDTLVPLSQNGPSDFMHNLDLLIDIFVEKHEKYKKPHQEIHALSGSNTEIADIIYQFENAITDRLTEACILEGLAPTHLSEKIHIIYNMVESYCHEVVYRKNSTLDYGAVKSEIIRSIHFILFGF